MNNPTSSPSTPLPYSGPTRLLCCLLPPVLISTLAIACTRENNNSARVANSTLRTANQQLEPLVNRDTNELIDDFPHTPEDIRGMNGMQDWTLAGYKQTSAVGRS